MLRLSGADLSDKMRERAGRPAIDQKELVNVLSALTSTLWRMNNQQLHAGI
jgi:hypothetical protein